MATRKAILTAGLGRYATVSPALIEKYGGTETLQRLAQADAAKATQAGFDVTLMEINPKEREASLSELKARLTERHWDGFLVGYGLRASLEHTELFETILNACRETSPRTRLLFSTAPDNVFATITRNFGEE